MDSTPGEHTVKTVETTTKDLEYYMNLADKAAAALESIDSNLERSSIVGLMLLNRIACYREMVHERKSQSMQQTSFLSHFKKFLQPPQPSANTTLIGQHHQRGGRTFHQQKIRLAEGSDEG